ncbi:uncharacterized protein BJ212DRAFT_1480596 [Suillus subaureus]|uniref:TNase-like domain-containing protein n=1 Tax=Suillus subaureus TaxID=48587 RepID=A0A9P7EBV5_9AGAM|nr:uncharacterized protein BJ212DRAFT_1480596 [Suillus subaureus]KAG1816737.1 hypothetical protein BJ212DRAFT_1480596 [Suillus subaureus]
MHLPWRQKQRSSEECTSSLPSEQRGLRDRWSATKDTLKTHVATAQDYTKDTLQEYNANIKNRLRAKAYELGSRPAAYIVLSGFFLGSVSTLGVTFVYRRYFRRLRTAEWVTPDILRRKRWVRGVVTSVGDADNFRLYHTPGIGWRWPLKFRRVPTLSKGPIVSPTSSRNMCSLESINKSSKSKRSTVRIAGVDAPEGSHFGRQAQPYAVEALAWLKDAIEGRIVYCQLVRRDQYSRIVSVVTLPPPFLPGWLITGRSLALEMIRAGTGLTYEQAGAEYGKYGKDAFLRAEAESRVARRGMWKHGTVGETPAQYKRRYAQSGTDVEAQVQGTAKAEKENSKEDCVAATTASGVNNRPTFIPGPAYMIFCPTSIFTIMKLTSTLVLSFIASAQAATTISSLILPSGVPASSGLPFSTISFDTTAATSVLSSLSSLYSSESSVVQSVLSSYTTDLPTSILPTVTSLRPAGLRRRRAHKLRQPLVLQDEQRQGWGWG